MLGLVRGLAARLRAALGVYVETGASLSVDPAVAGDCQLVFAADGQLKHVDEPFRAWWSAYYGEVPTTADELIAALQLAAPGTASARRLLPVSLALVGLRASELLALRTPAGRRRVHLRASPLIDADGRVRGAVAVWRDLGVPPVGGSWVEQTAPNTSAFAN
jgi:integrase